MISDFIIAAAGGLTIFVALFGAAQVLDNVFHYTDKTLEVMERDNPSEGGLKSPQSALLTAPLMTIKGSQRTEPNENKKKPAYEADKSEQLKYSTIEV